MTRPRTRSIPTSGGRLRDRARGRLVLSTALGGCLAMLAPQAAAQVVTLPVATPGPQTGNPVLSGPGIFTDTIGVVETGSVVNWVTFDVPGGQTVRFNDVSANVGRDTLTILNRVPGITASQINGTLRSDANVIVYLVNPSGIVFGGGSIVNVGGLVASTLAIDPDAFRLASQSTTTPREFRFAASGNVAPITVASGASLTATGLAGPDTGQIALIGARVDSAGTIGASGDVALVAANDVTLIYDAANPLGFTITEGTSLGTTTTGGVTTNGPMVVSGTIGGRSALFVAATRQSVTDAVLDISATVTATTALATDRGVSLIAGRNVGADARVTFTDVGGAPSSLNDGTVSLALGGRTSGGVTSGLSANGAGGTIALAASGGIVAGTSGIASILNAAQGVTVRASADGVVLGQVRGATASILADAGNIAIGAVTTSAGLVDVSAITGNATVGTLDAFTTGRIVADGNVTTTNATTRGGLLTLTATAGILSIGNAVTTGGGAAFFGGTDIRIGTADAAGAIDVTGAQIGGDGSRAALTADGALVIDVTGRALLGDVSGGTTATIRGASVDATSVGASTGALEIAARTGNLRVGRAAATAGSARLTAAAGTVVTGAGTTLLPSLSAGTSVRVDALATDLGVVRATTAIDIATTGTGTNILAIDDGVAGTVATLSSAGGMTIGTLGGATIAVDAAGTLTATSLDATTTLTGTAGSMDLGTVRAGAGDLSLTSRAAGTLALAGGTAGGATRLTAGGILSLTGTYVGTGLVDARAGGAATIGTLSSSGADTTVAAGLATGGALNATRLTAATDLTVTAPSFTIGSVAATGGTASLTARTGNAALTSAITGTDLTVTATSGTATIERGVDAGQDYIVSSRSVTLGDGTAALQSAGRAARITSTAGPITGDPLLTLRGGTGGLFLNATGGGIAFAANSILQGGIGRTSDIDIRLGTPGAALQLGRVDARSVSPIATDGNIDLFGPVTVTNQFTASTTGGSITTGSITVTGPGPGLAPDQGITLTTTRSGDDIVIGGALNAAGDLTLSARDTIAFTGAPGVIAGFGNVALTATDGAITGLAAVSAGDRAVVRANTGLTLASLTSGTRTGAADGSAEAQAATLSIGTATAATALTLTATDGLLRIGNGSAGTVATLTKTGLVDDLYVTGTLTAPMLSVQSATDIRFGTLAATGGTLTVAAVGGVSGTALTATGAGGDVMVDAGTLVRLTTLDAGGNAGVVAGNPVLSTSAGAIRIDDARGATLALTAYNLAGTAPAGVILGNGQATGTAILVSVGTGDVIATTLTADTGAASVDAAGNARLGTVTATNAAVTVTAGVALTGLARTVAATDGRLAAGFDGALLVAGPASDLTVNTGGLVQIGTALAGGTVSATAGGDAAILGTVMAGTGFAVTGNAVTLGLAGTTVRQETAGAVSIVSRTGGVAGLGGLALASDTDGNGGDLILRSAAGIAFADDTIVSAGGGARASTIRVGLASNAALQLGQVDAWTLASWEPGLVATTLRHDGPVTLGAVTVRDTLDIATNGVATPLTIASATSLTGDLILGASGALIAGTLDANGAIVASGASVLVGTTTAGAGVTLESTDGTLDIGAIDAATITLDAAGDLRLGTTTAPGAINVTATGDITGRAVPGGFGGAVLTGGDTVAITTAERDPARGLIRLDTVTGRSGVTVTGRLIEAASLTSDAGGIAVVARRNVAGVSTTGIAIGTVDASGDVSLRSGLGVPFVGGTGTIGVDSVISRAAGILVSNPDGDLRGLAPGTRATLRAPGGAGTIAVDLGGTALVDVAEATGDIALRANAIDLLQGTSTNGALALTATGGDLTLSTGSGRTGATLVATAGLLTIVTLDSDGPVDLSAARIDATAVTAGTTLSSESSADSRFAAVTSGGDATIGSGTTLAIGALRSAGNVTLSASSLLTATTLTAARDLRADAGSMDIATATATGGRLGLTASGDLRLGSGRAGGDMALRTTSGMLNAGSAGGLIASGSIAAEGRAVALTAVDAGTMLTVAAGTGGASITGGIANGPVTVTSGGDAGFTTLTSRSGTIAIDGAGTLDGDAALAATALTLSGGGVNVTRGVADTGALTATARSGPLTLVDARAGTSATLSAANGLATIGTLASGTLTDIRAATIAATRLTAGTTLTTASTGDTRIDSAVAGGDATLSAGNALTIGNLGGRDLVLSAGDTATATTLAAARTITAIAGALAIDDATATTGDLIATARTGALRLRRGNAGGAIAIDGNGVDLGTVGAGTILTVRSGGDLALVTGAAGGAAMLTAGRDLNVGTLTGTAITLNAGRDLAGAAISAAGPLAIDAGGTATLTRSRSGGATTVRAGSLVLTDGVSATAATVTTAGDARIGTIGAATDLTVNAGGGVTIGTAIATGGALAVTARGGDLTLTGGSAGGDAMLAANAGTLAIGTLNAAAVDLRAARITAGTVAARAGLVATSTAAAVLGTITSGGDTALTAGTTLAVDSLVAGGSARLGSTGTTTATSLTAGQNLSATAGGLTIGNAVTRRGALALTATGGDLALGSGSVATDTTITASGAAQVAGDLSTAGQYRIDAASVTLGTAATARQAAGGVAIVARSGSLTGGSGLTLASGAAGTAVTATAGSVAFAPGSTIQSTGGDITIAAGTTAALGTVTAAGRTIALSAQDATLAGMVSANAIRLTNIATTGVTRLGDMPTDNRAEFDQSGQRFDLATAELGRLAADSVVMDSRAQGVRIGGLALDAATGRSRFELRTSGRIDMLGRFTATGSPATRLIVLGGDGGVDTGGTGGRASVIRVAATTGGGGRLLVGDATLDLRGDRIGVGLDAAFLDTIGYLATTGLSVDQVSSRFVAQPNSTLYNASATGQPAYTDPVVLTARSLIVRYGQYALFQNTGRAGETTGAVLGTTPGSPTAGALQLVTAGGSVPNAFSIFGTINGIGSTATSLLGADAIAIDANVSRPNSRANGCLIGSAGGGCLSTSIVQPTLNIFDASRSEIFRTADDLSLPFDPLVGTNNEALFSDIGGYVPPADPTCGKDGAAPCPPVGDAK